MGKVIATKFSTNRQGLVKKRPGKNIANVKKSAEKRAGLGILKKRVNVIAKKSVSKKKVVNTEESSENFEVNVDKPKAEVVENLDPEYQDLRFEVITNSNSGRKYLKLVRPDCDLFADDELKARYDQYTKYNLIFTIFDEISLEGLDGITIEALWKRIQHTLKLDNLTNNFKVIVWQIICNSEIKFFELPVARDNLIISNKGNNTSKEIRVFPKSYYDKTGDIYKVVQAPRGSGHWGSCATLTTRVDITEEVQKISLDEAVSMYGNKLILLADENLRKSALVDDLMDPNYEFTQVEYCLLERIGRARDAGEITQGPVSLPTSFSIDPKSIFHYCKRLKKEHLVSRQHCFISSSGPEQTKVGRLMHLRRFYQKRKSKYLVLIENVIDYLKKCPGHRAPYTTVRSMFGNYLYGKFFKHSDFMKYLDTNIYVPFKEYYTDATYQEYMTKNLTKERIIQLVQLKDPFINIVACWSDNQTIDSSDDEDEDSDTEVQQGGRRIYNKEFITDVYHYIVSRGVEGAKTTEVHLAFDIDFHTMRSVLRKLCLRSLVKPFKFDVGRQTVNQYVATCLIKNPVDEVSVPKPIKVGPSTALERLKQKQKQKTDSLAPERIYTAEQHYADREHQLLSLDTRAWPTVTIQIPQIVCQFMKAEARAPQIVREMNIFVAKLRVALGPFKINLTLPQLPPDVTPTLRKISPRNRAQLSKLKQVVSYVEVFNAKSFKSDNLTKACLLQGLMDNLKINEKDVIDFLDPDSSSSRQAEKRPRATDKGPGDVRSKVMKVNENMLVVSASVPGLGMHMGSNPVVAACNKDPSTNIVTEIYVSTPLESYKTGDITNYVYDHTQVFTERFLARIAFILKIIQKDEVLEEMNKFLKLIFAQESKTGYDKRIDRKSLHRIYKKLTDEGYLKIYMVTLTCGDSRKTQTYVCHPSVTLDHPLLHESLSQLKEKVYCYPKIVDVPAEPVEEAEQEVPKISPFSQDDVLRSLREIKDLTKAIKAKSCKKSGKYYGRRPKFARVALIHELLFYLIYELDSNTEPLSKPEVSQLFKKYDIQLTPADLTHLPPVYCREISWKTFIPPLPEHSGWGEGWALLVDILLRFPITLITRCYSVNFVSTELQDVLQHPIKRFYLLRHVTPTIRMIVMYRRKFIHDMYNQVVLLGYLGLTQFGPSSFHDKEKSFMYLNRRATLRDTISSTPGYLKVEDKEYPTLHFEFNGMDDVLKYWSTMNNICIHTNLNTKRNIEGKTITLVHSTAKPGLMKTRLVKTQENVKNFDTGDLPGDHQGAAGLDSSLWSHVQRSWYFFATKNEPAFTESLETLKLDQIANNKVAFDQLKLPVSSNKYFIAKQPSVALSARKLKPVKPGTLKPIIKITIPIRKKKERKPVGVDAVDKATMRKANTTRYRPVWSEEEDKMLILLKIASIFVTPDTNKQVINYSAIRDVLFIMAPKSKDKTCRNISNRLRALGKSMPFMSNIESMIPNLFKLVPIAKYFVPYRKFVVQPNQAGGFHKKYRLSDEELHIAFIFLAYYFKTHCKEVQVSLHGQNTSTDYFSEENLDFFREKIEPFEVKEYFYLEPKTEVDIRKYALKNTVQSALSHKNHRPAWALQMYKIYQLFSEEVLRSVLTEMRCQRFIQSKKDPSRTFFTPYRLSTQYIFAQCCTFWYNTMEEAYATFLEFKYSPNEMDFSYEKMEEKRYGQLFGLNEVLSFMYNDTTLEINFPEYHLILNPAVEDHSEIVDELAKRYQAKLKSDQKEAEQQQTELQSDPKPDDEFTEAPEDPLPGPSIAASKEPEMEINPEDEDEPLDLSITAKNSSTIDSLKHWISDCIDTERVRSPSPELLTLEVMQPYGDSEAAKEADKLAQLGKREDLLMLSLDEIKEEMLKPYDASEKRLVPYISELTKLLYVNFEEIDGDERANILMKTHFVQQYPSLEKVTSKALEDHYLAEFLENRACISDVWVRVERETHVNSPSDKGVAFDDILAKGGTTEDVTLAYDMLNYIYDKDIYGAKGYELKEMFCDNESRCSMELILKILTDHALLLRTGVCAVTYVHHRRRKPWLTDTFTLTPEQAEQFPSVSTIQGDDYKKLEADIQGVHIAKWTKIKALPWASIDGTLDKDMLKMWLSQVFSYCIENPRCMFTAVCDKFCYLKPVDTFYLLETLEEIGALDLRKTSPTEAELFSEYEYFEEHKATCLDKFEEIFVETNNICFMTLGSFFQNL